MVIIIIIIMLLKASVLLFYTALENTADASFIGATNIGEGMRRGEIDAPTLITGDFEGRQRQDPSAYWFYW